MEPWPSHQMCLNPQEVVDGLLALAVLETLIHFVQGESERFPLLDIPDYGGVTNSPEALHDQSPWYNGSGRSGQLAPYCREAMAD